MHRISFEGLIRFEWVDSDREVWDKLELTQIEVDPQADGQLIEVGIELWDLARITLVCERVTWNDVEVTPDGTCR